MRITIHRGTHEIGGCVTEIATEKTRIFIDFGSRLPDGTGAEGPDTLPLPGLTQGKRACDGLFFTHYHGDHVGQVGRVLPGVPLYMGRAGWEIYACLEKRLGREGELPKGMRFLTPGRPISFARGDMTVTPLMVDHSAYDAYMFLVEGEGKRVLHTGDFRDHGFRGKGLWPTLRHYVGPGVDALVLEGTVLGRPTRPVMTEAELKFALAKSMRAHAHTFVLCASTNIDRIAAVQAAAKLARRPLFCDGFQRQVLEITHRHGAAWSGLYDFSRVRVYRGARYPFAMLIRGNRAFQNILNRFPPGVDNHLVYSMWPGYLAQETLRDFLRGRDYETLHTSGHATAQTLRRVCQAVSPRVALPIHTQRPQDFARLGLRCPVRVLADRESYQVR